MTIRFAVGVACLSLAAGTSSARDIAAKFDGTLGGSYTIGFNNPPSFSNTAAGMTFLSYTDGTLDSLNVYMGWNPGTPSNLIASFFTLNASNLPDQLVASRTVSQADLSATVGGNTFGTVTIDFSSGPVAYLGSGVRYAFTLVAENTGNYDGGPQPPFGLGLDATGAQFADGVPLFSPDGGATWGQHSYPIPFTVNTTVPAPGAAAGAIVALIGAAPRRRR